MHVQSWLFAVKKNRVNGPDWAYPREAELRKATKARWDLGGTGRADVYEISHGRRLPSERGSESWPRNSS